MKHRIPLQLHIIQNSPLLKTRESLFLLFVSLNVVLYLHVWVKSQSFSDNSNLIVVVNFQRLHAKLNEFHVFLTGFIFCLKEVFLLFDTVLLSYVIYSRVQASYILDGGTIPVSSSMN